MCDRILVNFHKAGLSQKMPSFCVALTSDFTSVTKEPTQYIGKLGNGNNESHVIKESSGMFINSEYFIILITICQRCYMIKHSMHSLPNKY